MGGDLVPRSLQMAREIRLEGKDYSPAQLYHASSGRMDIYRHAMREAGYVVPRSTERAPAICDVCGFHFGADSGRRSVAAGETS